MAVNHKFKMGLVNPFSTNPLINVCPRCEAARYELCFKWGGAGRNRFRIYLPEVHGDRTKVYSIKGQIGEPISKLKRK